MTTSTWWLLVGKIRGHGSCNPSRLLCRQNFALRRYWRSWIPWRFPSCRLPSFGVPCTDFYVVIIWIKFYLIKMYRRTSWSLLLDMYNQLYLIKVLTILAGFSHLFSGYFCFVLSVQTSLLFMSSHVIFASASFIFASAGEFIIQWILEISFADCCCAEQSCRLSLLATAALVSLSTFRLTCIILMMMSPIVAATAFRASSCLDSSSNVFFPTKIRLGSVRRPSRP